MPADTTAKLNAAQRDQIYEWFGEGFSDAEVLQKIQTQRQDDLTHDGGRWPDLSRQAIQYHRSRAGDRFLEQQANTFDLATQTGLARRQVLVRRASRRAGGLDHLIDRLEREIDRFLGEGVVHRLLYRPPDPDDVIEADYTKDGRPQGRVPAIPLPETGDLTEDPYYERLIDLLQVLPKQYAAHEKYLSLLAKLGGMGQAQKQDDDAETPSDRRRRAEALLGALGIHEREPSTVPRRGSGARAGVRHEG